MVFTLVKCICFLVRNRIEVGEERGIGRSIDFFVSGHLTLNKKFGMQHIPQEHHQQSTQTSQEYFLRK